MWKQVWEKIGRHSLCGAMLLTVSNLAQAQVGLPAPPSSPPMMVQASGPPGLTQPPGNAVTPVVAPPSLEEMKARLDRMEKQNQELIDALKAVRAQPVSQPALPVNAPPAAEVGGGGLSKDDVQKIVGDYLGQKEAQSKAVEAAKKAEADARGFTVGKNVGLSGTWKNNQPWFETSDQAFRIHFGGRFQPEWVLGAGSDKNVAQGVGGTGAFQEAFNMRRARIEVDGWVHEVIDFMVEYDFANQFSSGQPFTANTKTGAVTASPNTDANTFGVPAPTDVWAGLNYIPVIGGFRVGNIKPAIGLDHLTSSRYLDFMERSIGFDQYYNRNNGFAPGFMIFNYTENQRIAWQLSATKPTNTLFAWTTGGGEWDYDARITGLPWYEDNGRRMMHIGIGGKYIDRLDQGVANLNERWLLRNGGPNLQNTVSLVQANGISQAIVNPELFINLGPLSIQSEYVGSWVNGVTSYRTQASGGTIPVTSRTFFSQTAYIQALYFLTGESRPYAKTALHGSGAAPTRVVPFRNYFWVPGSGGNCNPFSAGAWQVGARYCWADNNDNGINGGQVNEVTLGLNWFLNPNMKFQWNYDIGHRNIPGGTSDGYFYGFGMRMTFDF